MEARDVELITQSVLKALGNDMYQDTGFMVPVGISNRKIQIEKTVSIANIKA
jgi:hypothetical protein